MGLWHKLVDDLAHHAGDEQEGAEGNDVGQDGEDDGHGHLARPSYRRADGRYALPTQGEDVLPHHYGVVDDHAEGHDEAEQQIDSHLIKKKQDFS